MFDFLMNPEPGRSSGRPQLPLDIVSSIISQIEAPADLARVSRSSRIHYFLTVPLLYRNVVLACRREERKSHISLAQMGALLKPGIAVCVQRLEVVNERPSGQDRRGEEHGVWAVAIVGIISGMTMLEEFLWNSESMMHPILYEALSRHPKLKGLRIIHPLSLHPPPPPSFAPPIAFRNLKRIHLTGLGSRTTYDWSIVSMPVLEVFKASWRISTRLSAIFPEHGPVRSPRVLKELHISNAVLDISLRQCLDLLELQKLSLLDCSVGESSSWDEILRAEEPGVVNVGSPASILSAGSGSVVKQSPIPTVRHLKLKSLRINEAGKHWVNFLSSFAGLEELYILPSTSVIEEDAVEPFLDAIINFHGPTIRNLRLSTSQPVERRCVSKLVRSCKGLEEMSLRIPKSEWKFIEILILFLTRIRVFQLLTTELSSPAEEYEELFARRENSEHLVAQEGESLLEIFGFGAKWAWVTDRTPSWIDTVDPETGRVEKRRVKRGHIERISMLSEKVGIWKAEDRI
ncbi:hypothetical protein L873DRAFT_1827146 [Choiromyces venosus 120613-1]|uniref:F-box domain-containing protein n=1 Tax=Choiromyces venosus 120613-1 TaxID=1336337 RepID=A0A3N4JWZ3_9PEZI|nr:hypothetical protein L873DRAFT_1827146 [Choiromyces venosus 120613-1]